MTREAMGSSFLPRTRPSTIGASIVRWRGQICAMARSRDGHDATGHATGCHRIDRKVTGYTYRMKLQR